MSDDAVDVSGYAYEDPSELDFKSLDGEVLEALFLDYMRDFPDMALGALVELSRRSCTDAAMKASTVALLAPALQERRVHDDVFPLGLYILYANDRLQGQRLIAEVVESCDEDTLREIVDCLHPDLTLHKGEPEFDKAVDGLRTRLKRKHQSGATLREEEVAFLRDVGCSLPASNM